MGVRPKRSVAAKRSAGPLSRLACPRFKSKIVLAQETSNLRPKQANEDVF